MEVLLVNTWLRRQFRVIGAISRKDFLIFLRYPANAVMSVIEPIMWLAPTYFMGQGFSVNGEAVGFAGFTGTSDYFSFVMLGMFMSSYISAAFWGMGFSVQEDMTLGVLEPNWVTPASRVSLILGRSVMMLLLTTINSIVVLAAGAVLFRVNLTGNVLAAVITMLPMLIALTGLGLGIAGVVLSVRRAGTAIDISNWAVTQLSGATFPVSVLPRPLLAVALALPTTYGFDAVRSILLGTKTMLPLKAEIGIMLASMVGMCAAGYAVFKAFERRCRRQGLLGTH
ncbi:MAG TPA: ABC transporter permease [Firmicutes bacterium]|jgi:ABC-2 type transport system permease protein|nr:ABC transporter permease [Bacillota bacterium]